jgi:hypothetical protein
MMGCIAASVDMGRLSKKRAFQARLEIDECIFIDDCGYGKVTCVHDCF